MNKYGLVGKNISYSFSRNYFTEKFAREGIQAVYENFDLESVSQFPEVLQQNPGLRGLNVTIPYKEAIIPFLDELDPVASEIGAVNTIAFSGNGKLKGYNTDYFGFMASLRPHLKPSHKKALILGTGGASKAISYALNSLGIKQIFVSRAPSENAISYRQLNDKVMTEHLLIINCTPLGTFPNVDDYPPVPVQFLGPDHLIFDLIYNPSTTKLMQLGGQKGASIVNGQQMLEQQAEKAWEIWNSSSIKS